MPDPSLTPDTAEELGFETGDSDGYAGNAYDGYNDQVPPEVDENYRQGYRQRLRTRPSCLQENRRWLGSASARATAI